MWLFTRPYGNAAYVPIEFYIVPKGAEVIKPLFVVIRLINCFFGLCKHDLNYDIEFTVKNCAICIIPDGKFFWECMVSTVMCVLQGI